MSHKVTTSTEMRDSALVTQALRATNTKFEQQGDLVKVLSGPMQGASINTRTGTVSGDGDKHSDSNSSLGFLKQHYAEQKIMKEFALNGIQIESRVVQKDGSILLTCQGSFA